jgi:UDP-N-acetylglucosamine--N-acetylmuramyl-(pentapeptide) pyrophosphoryl-undecaprenol N-acetylglucosamine transferase
MRVLLVGGGTLGSVTPLLAVAEAINESEISNLKFEIRFWGTRRGPERQLVEAAGIPFRSIPAGKLRRYWDLRNILDTFVIAWAFIVALVRLIRERQSVVVGAGSFVQVPVMLAAWFLRIPIVIHQLDMRPSLANRLVAPFATRITVTFQQTRWAFPIQKVAIVGTPVRPFILATRRHDQRAARERFALPLDIPTILAIGGGTGAKEINDLIRRRLREFVQHATVIHITGIGKGWDSSGLPPFVRGRYRQFQMLTDALPWAYAAADIVISRAGMGTIVELAALGKPMLLIPMAGTHQEENAAAMEECGAAVVWNPFRVMPYEVARGAMLPIALLKDAQWRASLARHCARIFPIDATAKIAKIVLRVAVGERAQTRRMWEDRGV